MKNHRKKAIAILAGLAVTGIVGASAASLGTVTGQSLGATTEIVASCDDAVTVDYTSAYDAASNTFLVSSVTIGDVDAACAGLDWEVVLTGDPLVAAGPQNVLASGTGTLPAVAPLATSFSLTGISADAELVTGIAITISG